MHPLLHIATEAAREAGKTIVRAFDRLDTVSVSEKKQNDLVTEIDKLAEEQIIGFIRKAHPNHSILGEESGEITGNDTCWIIDPLDGTTNFVHGIPHFSISIAVKHKNKYQVGVIFDPIRQEMFMVTAGEGARLNDHKIRVKQNNKLITALLGTGFPYRELQNFKPYLKIFANVVPQCRGLRRMGSAALDLAYVAAGRFDGFWEFGLKPWDYAAGVLMIQESGGLVTDLLGGDTYEKTGNILAATPEIHEQLKKIIQPLTAE